jgi:hypothetical protein
MFVDSSQQVVSLALLLVAALYLGRLTMQGHTAN